MMRLVLAVALGVALPATGCCDLYVKKAARSTAHVDSRVVSSRNGEFTETWVGDGRVASHEGNKTILIDLNAKWFCIVNHREMSYVKASLPLNVSEVLSDDLKTKYEGRRVSGSVEKTDRTRDIASMKCDEYSVTYWDVTDGNRSNERTITVWATEDLSFDEKDPPSDIYSIPEGYTKKECLSDRDF